MSLYLLCGPYDWTAESCAAELSQVLQSFQAESQQSSSSGAQPTAHSWGPEPPQHPPWRPMPPQHPPLLPKAGSDLVAPGTPPADAGLAANQEEARQARQRTAAKDGPKPPSTDPLVAFVQGQADVPLVIDR